MVRPAPNFRVEGVANGARLREFSRAAGGAGDRAERAGEGISGAEVYRLKQIYAQLSNEKVIFVAAIENGPAVVKSNIPFMMAANPTQVAADYGVPGRFGIAVIGVDGNLDLITTRVIPAERVRDMVFNNFESQAQFAEAARAVRGRGNSKSEIRRIWRAEEEPIGVGGRASDPREPVLLPFARQP